MPKLLKTADELKPGDYYEDCAYHPCLCVAAGKGEVEGISLADGSFPRNCGVPQCGVRKLTLREAIQWRCFGPPDVPPEIEMKDTDKYWLKHEDYAGKIWPKLRRKRKTG
jgi:hypothetical protein